MKNIIKNFRGLVAEAEYWDGYPDETHKPGLVERLFGRRVDIRLHAIFTMLQDAYARAYCARFGHEIEAEDFVSAEYEDLPDDGLDRKPRMTDISGGGVDWYCTRCHMGGRNWF